MYMQSATQSVLNNAHARDIVVNDTKAGCSDSSTFSKTPAMKEISAMPSHGLSLRNTANVTMDKLRISGSPHVSTSGLLIIGLLRLL